MDEQRLPQRSTLTDRELEVLTLIADGLSTEMIAKQLVLSPHTVAWYIKQVFTKLDVNRRTQAVAKAREFGLLDDLNEDSDFLTISKHNKPRYKLPTQPTSFIGRQDEIVRIVSMLGNKNCRLLTIIGPGGIGKTRLALEVAVSTVDKSNSNVCYVALQPLTTHSDIIPAIVSSLGIRLQGGRANLFKQLNDYLRDKSILLIMDNFEHLLEGTQFVSDLLSATSKVQILATSREALKLREEHLFKVEGLQFPEHVQDKPTTMLSAIELFKVRATQLSPDFTLDGIVLDVIEICQLVSGIPLALELAASWIKTLSCEQIATEIKQGLAILATPLRNMPERHRSMQVVFDYSWKMLSDKEQTTFQRLSVFRGGFTLATARYVADTNFNNLQLLIDKSFISFDHGSNRFYIHELLRQYGELHLNQSAHDVFKTSNLHCTYFAEFLDQLREDGFGHKQAQLIKDVGADLENIRSAWRWAVEHVKVEHIQKSAQTLYVFYTLQSRFQEAADELTFAIRRLNKKEKKGSLNIILAELLNYCAWSHIRFGNYQQATSMLKSSQTIYQQFKASPQPGWTTEPLVGLSLLSGIHGDYEEAEKLGREAYRISEERRDKWELQTALYVTTSACFHQGKYEEARKCAEQANAISIETGDQWFRAIILNDLGRIAYVLGKYPQAKKYFSTSFAIRKTFEDPQGMAAALNHLGQIAMLESEFDEARYLYLESYELYQEIGDRGGVGSTLCGLGSIACTLGDYQLSRHYYYQALQITKVITYVSFAFSILVKISELFLDTWEYALGLELLALITQNNHSDKQAIEVSEQILAAWHDKIRSELGEEAFHVAWERGKSLDLETVIQELLDKFNEDA